MCRVIRTLNHSPSPPSFQIGQPTVFFCNEVVPKYHNYLPYPSVALRNFLLTACNFLNKVERWVQK